MADPQSRIYLDTETSGKLIALRSIIHDMDSVVVAFSGGVDSTLLLKVAHDELGERCVAASGLSETYAPEEMVEARALANEMGVEYVLLQTMELTDSRYADNTHQRCFFCKQELYGRLTEFAAERKIAFVIDGSNADDLDDFRPGLRAARDLGVRSPLQEVGLVKAEIRELSAMFGLRTADKPAVACLSSRFAYGDKITVEKLEQVASAESGIKALGFNGFRLRHHGNVARLEFSERDLDRAFGERRAVIEAVKSAGYRFVTMDLEGYRSGNMNQDVPEQLISIQKLR
ncbi:MAG: ATP-dependent sacrificial sulfur transferase LarE [Chloroflexota bacterium]|nr:ATP-dependent sacrificial sulfur transferase LarE [Chloroflexota bacterium]